MSPRDFLEDVSSWWWWLTSVILAIAINLASSYLKPPIDRWIARRSDRRRELLERKQKHIAEVVERIAGDPNEQVMLGLAIIQNRIRSAIFYFFSGMTIIAMGITPDLRSPATGKYKVLQGFLIFMSIFSTITAMSESGDAFRRAQLLDAARKRLDGLVLLAPYNRPPDRLSDDVKPSPSE